MSAIARKPWAPHFKRHSVQSLLVTCGMPHSAVYLNQNYTVERFQHPQLMSFWDRHDGQLEELAVEARRAFRGKVREIRPDLPGNEAASRPLLQAWRRLRRLFAVRGVML